MRRPFWRRILLGKAMSNHEIKCRFFSQEDLLGAGCLDIRMAIEAAEKAMLAFDAGEVMFPEKIVQIFNDDTQERINCLPATFKNLWREVGFSLSAQPGEVRDTKPLSRDHFVRDRTRVPDRVHGRHTVLQRACGNHGGYRCEASCQEKF